MLELGDARHAFDPSIDLAAQARALEALRGLPDTQSDAITRALLREAPALTPPFLFELARRLWNREPDLAMEWYAIALLRAQYDAMRCSDPSAAQGAADAPIFAPNVAEGAARDRAAYGRAGLRALTRPELFAGSASPLWMCAHGLRSLRAAMENRQLSAAELIKPENEWPALRETIRREAQRTFEDQGQPPPRESIPIASAHARTDLERADYDGYAWIDARRLAVVVNVPESGVPWRILRVWRRDGAIEDIARFRGNWCAGNGVIAYQTNAERVEGNRLRITYRTNRSGIWTEETHTLEAPVEFAELQHSGDLRWRLTPHAERQSPFDCRWVRSERLSGPQRSAQWLPLLPGHGMLLIREERIVPATAVAQYFATEDTAPVALPIAARGLPLHAVRYFAFRGAYFISPIVMRPENGSAMPACISVWWLYPGEARAEEVCVPTDSVNESGLVLYAPWRDGMLRAAAGRETSRGVVPGGLYVTTADRRTEKVFGRLDFAVSPDGCAVAVAYPEGQRFRRPRGGISVLELCR